MSLCGWTQIVRLSNRCLFRLSHLSGLGLLHFCWTQDKEPSAGHVKTLTQILITLCVAARITFWRQIQLNQDKPLLIQIHCYLTSISMTDMLKKALGVRARLSLCLLSPSSSSFCLRAPFRTVPNLFPLLVKLPFPGCSACYHPQEACGSTFQVSFCWMPPSFLVLSSLCYCTVASLAVWPLPVPLTWQWTPCPDLYSISVTLSPCLTHSHGTAGKLEPSLL